MHLNLNTTVQVFLEVCLHSKMPTVEEDTIKLLHIFPEELWRFVLKKVTDCTTFQTLRLSFPLFASFTDSLVAQVLFPAVVDYIFRSLIKSDSATDTLVNCRLVSRAWKHGVDSFLENKEPHLKLTPNDLYQKYPKYLLYFLKSFYSLVPFSKDAENINRYFMRSHGFLNGDSNPFVGRSIAITLHGKNDPFIHNMSLVLERWGHHIWFAYFRINHDGTNCYNYFSRLMEYLPNVKVLNVMVYDNTGTNEEFEAAANIPVFQHYPQLQCIKTYDLPEFVRNKLKERNLHVAQVHVKSPEHIRVQRIQCAEEREKAMNRFYQKIWSVTAAREKCKRPGCGN